MKNILKIDLDRAPRGITDPVALVDASPLDLERYLNISFDRSRDDLDDLYAACIKTDNGTYFGLVYHLNAPTKGMEVRIKEPCRNPVELWKEFMGILSGMNPHYIWIRPDLMDEK